MLKPMKKKLRQFHCQPLRPRAPNFCRAIVENDGNFIFIRNMTDSFFVAGAFLASMPVIIIFITLSRYFAGGPAVSAPRRNDRQCP
jgi:ABC-type glycerol-3-phosphate transport system permease component